MVHQKWLLPGEMRAPLILCEYAHAMGTALAVASSKYRQAFRQYPAYRAASSGTADQSLIKYDETATRGRLTAVIFGDTPNDRQFWWRTVWSLPTARRIRR